MGIVVRVAVALTSLTLIFAIFSGPNIASEVLNPGMRYKIIKPVYLVGVYNSLNNRKLSRETARAYLESMKYAVKSEVAFQVKVPAGTMMTIASSAKKVWHFPDLVDQYVVVLEPDLSRGLDVFLDLDRGMEGGLDGLNPELFARVVENKV